MSDAIRTTQLTTKPACPVCRALLDGAIGVGTPDPESLTVCMSCGVFLSFTASMELRVLTDREWADLPRDVQQQLTHYLNVTEPFRRKPEP